MGIIFHITQRRNWEKAQSAGSYHIQSLETEGFIHCSRHYQICEVANFNFKGQSDLILLAIDENKVAPKIIYEGPTWNRFPHIYGPLNLNAVVKTFEFTEAPGGGFIFPSDALKLAVESSAMSSTGPGYNIPKHYDAMNGEQGSDVDFYVQMAVEKQGSVLDLACGSGRFSLPIARAGCAVTGLDLSGAMINRAREKARAQKLDIDFQLGDIRLFELDKKFDFIFCGFNSSQHLHEEKEFVSFLECVKRYLAPQGVFAFDIFNPSVKMLSRDPLQKYPVSEYPNPEGEGTVKVWEYPSYDSAAQISAFKFSYELESKVLFEEGFSLRNYFPLEMNAILRDAGFSVMEKFGSFRKEPFTSSSMKQIFVCR